MMLNLSPGDALVMVDVQRDFLPGGSAAVPGGDQILAPLCRLIPKFQSLRLPVFATRDWHPPKHRSFLEQGGTWPVHCVAGTDGARFAPNLPMETVIPVSKATQAEREAFSGFAGTDLDRRLVAAGSSRLFIAGLATDFCVLRTVEDAAAHGYEVFVLEDAIRGVNRAPGDEWRAKKRMVELGAHLILSEQVRSPAEAA